MENLQTSQISNFDESCQLDGSMLYDSLKVNLDDLLKKHHISILSSEKIENENIKKNTLQMIKFFNQKINKKQQKEMMINTVKKVDVFIEKHRKYQTSEQQILKMHPDNFKMWMIKTNEKIRNDLLSGGSEHKDDTFLSSEFWSEAYRSELKVLHRKCHKNESKGKLKTENSEINESSNIKYFDESKFKNILKSIFFFLYI